ncbi:MAG: MarC family protein [Victivallales bacterium]|nr:MarC family protein [Victivallales bacterium]
MDIAQVFKDTLYFLAILNPASKILFLSAYQPPLSFSQNFALSWRSSIAAFLILLVFALSGNFVLQEVFRIDMYSLRVCGGLILFFTGWHAIREGRFTDERTTSKFDVTEVSIIPLAAPLITGPGTITIAITIAGEHGHLHVFVVTLVAVLINFLLMTITPVLHKGLQRMHLIGPLIRITGLIVASVAIQMFLTGLAEWLANLPR